VSARPAASVRCAGWLFLFALLTTSSAAFAHLMPSKQGTLNVVGDSVFAVVSVPVSALHGFDDDGDGLLSTKELRSHLASLQAEVDRRFVVSNGAAVGKTVLINMMLSPQHDTAGDKAEQLIVLKHVQLDAPPTDLRLECDLFGERATEREISITATRMADSGSNAKETEVATFTPQRTDHRFFRPFLQALTSYVDLGAEHVLLGPDHLLFLLTVIVAGFGLRYWLGVVTTFTLAHSVTLGLAMLGYVRLSPTVVEPLIALSIVLVAMDNLLRPAAPPRQRVALVGAFGLLHGLGFAASMDAMGLDRVHRISSLVGFNLGVEVGQAVFLCAVLALLFVIRRAAPLVKPAYVMRGVSALAVVIGSLWMVERMVT